MTNINDLTTRSKSALLARAMGWHYAETLPGVWDLVDADGVTVAYNAAWQYAEHVGVHEHTIPDLYQERNFSYAWRAANFVAATETAFIDHEWVEWWAAEYLHDHDPIQAQALILDKALELLIDAGLADLEM